MNTIAHASHTASLAELSVRRIVEELRRRVEGLRPLSQIESPRLQTGIREIDEGLLSGGIPMGGLVEWLSDRPGSGAEDLALRLAAAACRRGGAAVIVDGAGTFYPPVAFQRGIDPAQLLLVRPASRQDAIWAVYQSLADENVAAVFAAFPRVSDIAMRRFQLAAEKSGGLGLILRPEAARHSPCWAAVRLLVEPRPWPRPGDTLSEARRLRIHLLAARGMIPGRSVEVLVHEPTYPLPDHWRLAERLRADAARRPQQNRVWG